MDGMNLGIHQALLHALFIYIQTLFQPPPQSSRPEVIKYQILHNITGSLMVNTTNETTYVINGVKGGVYLFTIVAVNTLGNGKGATITATGS